MRCKPFNSLQFQHNFILNDEIKAMSSNFLSLVRQVEHLSPPTFIPLFVSSSTNAFLYTDSRNPGPSSLWTSNIAAMISYDKSRYMIFLSFAVIRAIRHKIFVLFVIIRVIRSKSKNNFPEGSRQNDQDPEEDEEENPLFAIVNEISELPGTFFIGKGSPSG